LFINHTVNVAILINWGLFSFISFPSSLIMSPIAVPHEHTTVSEDQSPTTFEGIPPFPDTVPTAPLLRISLSKLLAGDAAEEGRVWEASCKLGFFYLDLCSSADSVTSQRIGRVSGGEEGENGGAEVQDGGKKGVSGGALLEDAERLFRVGEEVLRLPVEEKEKYDFKDLGSYFGYKGLGASVVDREGNRDMNEFYNVSLTFFFSSSAPLECRLGVL
jgi:non-haem dioxygenase in morphine synthesis N-terminal